MKKSSLKLSTIPLALSMAIILLANTSCKSTCAMPAVQSSDTTSFIQRSAQVDTIYHRDNIFIKEIVKGDTVYLTRTEYRDRWRVRLVHDTICDTQYVTQVIEHPPERYVPPFYKWTTGLLFIFLFILGVRIYIKLKG